MSASVALSGAEGNPGTARVSACHAPSPPLSAAHRFDPSYASDRCVCGQYHDLSQEHDPDSQGENTPPPRRAVSACERPHHNAKANAVSRAAGTGRELR